MVLAVAFWAHLKDGQVAIVADDDVSEMLFIPLADVELQKVYFPAVRKAIEKLQACTISTFDA